MFTAPMNLLCPSNSLITDPYFPYVVSLLHLNGANGSTTFTDQKGVSWTRGGTPTISTAQSKFGGASGVFNGSTDYLYTAASSDFNLSGVDFTVDTWVYLNNITSYPYLFHFYVDNNNRWAVQVNSSTGYIELYATVASSNQLYSTTTVVPTGQQVHIEIGVSGGVTKLFVDGVLALSSSAPAYPNANTQIILAAAQFIASANYLNGYEDDFRVTKGACRHTSAFTPPTYQAPDS